jgi:N-acetyllactosaminide beta-1,6-N-acetylglucosaminyltransferase
MVFTCRRNSDRTEGMPPPPVNITLSKGSVHIVATRAFVDYVINNETALKFLNWVKKTYIPDETFFSSLNHSPQLGVPGSYLGKNLGKTVVLHWAQCLS